MKSKILNIIMMLSFIFIISHGLQAQGLKDLQTGYDFHGWDGKTLSTTGIGVGGYLSPFSALINPALLSSERWVVELGVTGARLEERRAFPVYDRFGGILTKGTYVINDNTFTKPTLWFSYLFKEKYQVGFFLLPFKSFEYKYNEQVRENIFGDYVIAYNSIRGDGVLQVSGINLSGKILADLQIGLNVGLFNKPTLSYEQKSVWVDSTDAFAYMLKDRNIHSITPLIQMGALYRWDERLSLGLNIRLPITVKMNAMESSLLPDGSSTPTQKVTNDEFKYPLTLSTGLEYKAQTPFRTRLLFDYSYQFWSSSDYKIQDGISEESIRLYDTYSVGTALELTYLHKNTFIVSYNYSSTVWNRDVNDSRIGIGLGFPIPRGEINAGIIFSRRTYNELDLFPDSWFGGDRSLSPLDDVEENFMYGSISIKIYLK